MLFIGDVHITSKHAPHILAQIQQAIAAHPEEKHIIFLGDYVYHFTYDRKALLELFDLFLTLATQQKHVYILAGNHDWLGGHFVFEEARKTFQFTGSSYIHIDTKPIRRTIEGVMCLFFPFYYPSYEAPSTDYFPELYHETHPQRRMSRAINNILHAMLASHHQDHPNDRLLLIHHWYIAKTRFPGQQATYGYESPALDPTFLTYEYVWAISGHLHEAFCYERYLCTGSLWHTSPLEVNQQKYIVALDTQKRLLHTYPICYNPYIQLPFTGEIITKQDIDASCEETAHRIDQQLSSGVWEVLKKAGEDRTLSHATVTITTDHYDKEKNLSDMYAADLLQEVTSIKHKLIYKADISLLHDLDRASYDLHTRFSDRKLLLRDFLTQKYGSEADRYISFLEEEKLL